jgi:hypothetical protein
MMLMRIAIIEQCLALLHMSILYYTGLLSECVAEPLLRTSRRMKQQCFTLCCKAMGRAIS